MRLSSPVLAWFKSFPWPLLALVVTVSCFRGARAPDVAPSRTLNLEAGEGGAVRSESPFRVVFSSPEGEVDPASQVTVMFSRPMRQLELAGQEAPSPVDLRTSAGTVPPGRWQWVGTRAVTFVPERELAPATEYRVQVPAGTKALDGSSLAEAHRFGFSTPRPAVERVEPAEGSDHLQPNAAFTLRFNQGIDPVSFERAASLVAKKAGSKEKLAFRARWPFRDNKKLLEVAPTRPLPLSASIELALSASLVGLEGPLPLAAERSMSWDTYGPLRATTFRCSRPRESYPCEPRSGWGVRFSNAVKARDLKQHLRLEPPGPISLSGTEDALSEDFWVPSVLAPARGYRLVVTAGLKDEYGQTLATDQSFPFATADERPEVAWGVRGEVIEANTIGAISVASINVPTYELLSAPVSEEALAELLALPRPGPQWHAVERLPNARVETVRSKVSRNVASRKDVPLKGVMGSADSRGAMAIGVSWNDPSRTDSQMSERTEVRLFTVTDLGISAKMSRFGSLVWVTRLSSGKPVGGAEVTLHDSGGKRTTLRTEADGTCVFPREAMSEETLMRLKQDAFVVAREGNDWSFRRLEMEVSPTRSNVPFDPAGTLMPMGFLFTDRGVYRPGETIRLKGLFREQAERGMATPVGKRVKIVLQDSVGTQVFEKSLQVGAFGEVTCDVPLPKTARLGEAYVQATLVDTEETMLASSQVLLAAYKASEFKVSAEPDRPNYVRGASATFTTRGDFLFGAPMTGAQVSYTLSRGPTSFAPPGGEGFTFDDDTFVSDLTDTNARAGVFRTGSGALDAKGSFAFRETLSLPGQRGPELVTFEAEVADLSRQTLTGRTSAVVHPGEFYVGLTRKDFFGQSGRPVDPQVVAMDPAGVRRAGVRVRVELVRRTWTTVSTPVGEGSFHRESKTVDKTVATCDLVTTASGPTGCGLTVPANERGYFVVRATAKDDKNNHLSSSLPLYVFGNSGAVGWGADDRSVLELVSDKKTYEIGEIATILVKNPFPEAEALVTVERSGIYRRERRTLSGAMPTLQIPITEELLPNAFVSVHLVRGRAAPPRPKGPDVGAPASAVGFLPLTINPDARRLRVSVTPQRTELRPGELVVANLAVTDRSGKPVRSDVTFYAVDEGVLLLTDYKTPDPLPTFMRPRPLAGFGLESRTALAKLVRLGGALSGVLEGGDKGDEGGGGGPSLRDDFRSTAYFEPSVVTGEDGKATVRFKLPDNLTTFRLMAVVAGVDDRFGFGEARVTASRPLMARPALPRFVRTGDELEAGVIVSGKRMAATAVTISARAEGIELRGSPERVIKLPANGSVEVKWSYVAAKAGTATFHFRAKGGDEVDEVTVTRPVESPAVLEAVALYGDTKEAVGERLGDLAAIRPDVGGLTLRLSSSALVGLENGVEQLLEYPYGCTEQLTSRLVPLVALRDLAKAYGIEMPKNADHVIETTIARILERQRGDGGFGWWPDSQASDPWVTAYALWGLELARKSQHMVPETVRDSAVSYVRDHLARLTFDRDSTTGAFLADVLAELGLSDPGYLTRLFEARNRMSVVGQAWLAHAMTSTKGREQDVRKLLGELENRIHLSGPSARVVENVGDGYAHVLDSEARTSAVVLRALVHARREHPLGAALARGLLDMRDHGTWRTTQETAWVLLALDDYRKAQEREAPSFDARVFLGGSLLLEHAFQGHSVKATDKTIAAAELGAAGGSTLAFTMDGRGRLFYEARLRYARKELPKDEIDRGFFVRKLVRQVKPESLRDMLGTLPSSSTSFALGGELVLVDLLVETPEPRDQVVIDDPLPAGLEAIQTELATSTRTLDVGSPQGPGDSEDEEVSTDDDRAMGGGYVSTWYRREVHDDRVLTFVEHMPAGVAHYRYVARATTFGRFVLPSTRAECMYQPETFGRTGSTVFEVKVP